MTRSRNRREQIRGDQQRFARAGGTVERLAASGPHGAAFVELHRRTRRSVEAKDSPRLPIEVTEAFFTHYDALPASARCIVATRIEDAWAGSSNKDQYSIVGGPASNSRADSMKARRCGVFMSGPV